MQESELTVTQSILAIVEEEIARVEAEREAILDRFITNGSWTERNINHGQLLALATIRGRLQAIIESEL